MMNAISLTHLSKQLGSFRLELPQLTISAGLITGFVGENGAGKTTTIKLIMNMLFADSGTIEVLERPMPQEAAAIKAQIGFVGDPMGLPDGLTLKQLRNVLAPFHSQWDDNVFYQYLQRFQLDERKKYGDLSKGMRRQFDLITALSHHPRLLILDEPTANLDPLARDELLDILLEYVLAEDVTVFFSTHITSDLEKVADEIIFLNQGQVFLQAGKDELLETHRIVRGKNALYSPELAKHCLHVTENSFSFEALCRDYPAAYELLGDEAVYDKATLNDIFIGYMQNNRAKPSR